MNKILNIIFVLALFTFASAQTSKNQLRSLAQLGSKQNVTCSATQWKNTFACKCKNCASCLSGFECPTQDCTSSDACCCPEGKLSYTDSNGVRQCTEKCPENYCEFGNTCMPHASLICPAGFFKLAQAKEGQCCQRCKDPCCKRCSADGEQCQSCHDDQNPDTIMQPTNGMRCNKQEAPKGLAVPVDFSKCNCCKKAFKQCHCQYANQETTPEKRCHKGVEECPLCPEGSAVAFYKDPQSDQLVYDNYCDECDSSCMFCFGKQSNNCLLCSPNSKNKWLHENQCLESCPEGHFGNQRACNKLKHKKCAAPYTGFWKEGHDDPALYEGPNASKDVFGYCEKCSPLCKTCSGPQNNQCETCYPGNTAVGDVPNKRTCIPDSQLQQYSVDKKLF